LPAARHPIGEAQKLARLYPLKEPWPKGDWPPILRRFGAKLDWRGSFRPITLRAARQINERFKRHSGLGNRSENPGAYGRGKADRGGVVAQILGPLRGVQRSPPYSLACWRRVSSSRYGRWRSDVAQRESFASGHRVTIKRTWTQKGIGDDDPCSCATGLGLPVCALTMAGVAGEAECRDDPAETGYRDPAGA
jgi:hypothetical protein